jgi:hypothetical protein
MFVLVKSVKVMNALFVPLSFCVVLYLDDSSSVVVAFNRRPLKASTTELVSSR